VATEFGSFCSPEFCNDIAAKIGDEELVVGIRILENGTIKFVVLDLLRTVPIQGIAVVKGE
jgi:hypothetical protein